MKRILHLSKENDLFLDVYKKIRNEINQKKKTENV